MGERPCKARASVHPVAPHCALWCAPQLYKPLEFLFLVAAFTTLTLHQGWRQTYFGIASGAGDAADDADPDRDGLKNLLEYALNLHPNATSRMPASMQKADGTGEYTYSRATAAKNGGTTFQVEWSDNLTTWSGAGVVETLLSDDGTTQQVKATLPAGSGGRRFVRLRVQ